MAQISGKDVATHNSRESCWIIVHGEHELYSRHLVRILTCCPGKVYDVTEFLDGESGLQRGSRTNTEAHMSLDHPGELAGMKAQIIAHQVRISRRKQDHPEICWQRCHVCITLVLCYDANFTRRYSQEYDPIHPPDAITTNLPKEKQYVGSGIVALL